MKRKIDKINNMNCETNRILRASRFMLHASRRGQVMLLTVVLLSGTVLGATTIAGLLMLQQIRQATLATDSMRAIFAADAGLEWEFYKATKDQNYKKPVLGNGAVFVTKNDGITIKSTGYANPRRAVARALEASF